MNQSRNMVQSLAPEDIRPGLHVCVLNVVYEVPPFLLEGSALCEGRPPKMVCLPDDDETPVKIVEVCLPFMLAERPDGSMRTLDVRRYRLARVSDRFARKLFMRSRHAPGNASG